MKLVNPSDLELDTVFAEQVAGWKRRLATHDKPVERCGMKLPNSFGHPIEAWWHETDENNRGVFARPPRFTKSADAVLPYVSKLKEVGIHYVDGDWFVRCWSEDKNCGNCDSLAKACVIALLRANGVTVEFTEIMSHEELDESSDSVTGAGDK